MPLLIVALFQLYITRSYLYKHMNTRACSQDIEQFRLIFSIDDDDDDDVLCAIHIYIHICLFEGSK